MRVLVLTWIMGVMLQNTYANSLWLKVVKNEVSQELYDQSPLASLSLLRDNDNKIVPVFKYEGKYTIQVASYKTEIEAINHAEKIKQKDPRVFYQPIKIDEKIWFRVNVGNFKDLDAAKSEYQNFLDGSDEKNAFVTFLATDTDKQKVLFKGKEKKDKRQMASVETADEAYYYTIQVGSFNNQKEALEKSAQFKKLSSEQVFIHAVEIKGKPWFRIYIGRFGDKNKTKEFLKSYKSELSGAFIKKVHSKHLSQSL